jgi:hypothetical protein
MKSHTSGLESLNELSNPGSTFPEGRSSPARRYVVPLIFNVADDRVNISLP